MKSSNSSPSSINLLGIIIFLLLLLNLAVLEAFESHLQLPRSGGNKRSRHKRVLHVKDFGANADGVTDDTEALRNAWKVACLLSPRSRIVIPEGDTYLVRQLDFAGPCKSKVTLMISGTIVAPKDPEAWDGLNSRKWLYFHGVKHLSVMGGGTINGMGEEWWARSCKINKTNPCTHAPTAITFHRCKNLRVSNIKLINSQQMHMSFTNCMRVLVSNVLVMAPAESPNTDGIHISSSTGVEVRDTAVGTGDDCFSIVNNSSSVLITGVACGPGHGISVGSLGKGNSSADVHDIMVDGAVLSNTQNGVRIKTWQGGEGSARKIAFQNVFMDNVSNPIIIDQYYCDSPNPCLNQTSAVQVSDISYVRIKGTSTTNEAIKFACSDSFPCKGLYLEDIQLILYTGQATAFCWQAQGSSSGFVSPPPCFPTNETFIKQKVSAALVAYGQ